MVSLSDFAEQNNEETKWESDEKKEENPKSETATSETPSEPAQVSSTVPSPSTAPSTGAVQLGQTPTAETNQANILNSILEQIGDIGDRTWLKILVYGEPGSAKSSFAAGAANNLIYDLEDGLVRAKKSPRGIANNVKAIPFKSWDQSRALLGSLQQHPEELESYEIFSIDTLSELHKRGLAEVTEREYRKRPGSVNRFVAETDHHAENNEKIVRFFRALRDLDRHLIVVAHSRTVEPKNRPAKTFPDFSESLANKIMAFMDVVIYMEMRKVDGKNVPVGRFISDGKIAAKNGVGLPEEVIDPTFDQVKAAWENTKDD